MNLNITEKQDLEELIVVSVKRTYYKTFERSVSQYKDVYIKSRYRLTADIHEPPRVLYIIGGDIAQLDLMLDQYTRDVDIINLLQRAFNEPIDNKSRKD